MTEELLSWFGVRCVFRDSKVGAYEERITIWRARGFDDAVFKAESEALDYASIFDSVSYVGLVQVYAMDEEPGEGSEVFSLIRDSNLNQDNYVNRFFDTGDERQQNVD